MSTASKNGNFCGSFKSRDALLGLRIDLHQHEDEAMPYNSCRWQHWSHLFSFSLHPSVVVTDLSVSCHPYSLEAMTHVGSSSPTSGASFLWLTQFNELIIDRRLHFFSASSASILQTFFSYWNSLWEIELMLQSHLSSLTYNLDLNFRIYRRFSSRHFQAVGDRVWAGVSVQKQSCEECGRPVALPDPSQQQHRILFAVR